MLFSFVLFVRTFNECSLFSFFRNAATHTHTLESDTVLLPTTPPPREQPVKSASNGQFLLHTSGAYCSSSTSALSFTPSELSKKQSWLNPLALLFCQLPLSPTLTLSWNQGGNAHRHNEMNRLDGSASVLERDDQHVF